MKIKQYILKALQKLILMTNEKEMIPIPKPINANIKLDGKIALITGGNSGIGFAIAESFIRNGCKVIIAGTNERKLTEAANKLGGGDVVRYIQLDVLDIASIPEKIYTASSFFKESRIDILVNSAGVIAKSSFDDMSEEEYDYIMDTNAKGVFFMSQFVSKHMIEHKVKGHILNVTSSSALRPAWTPYQMSKWAVRGLTLGLADNLLKNGIIVNAIAPGPVATAMLDKSEGDSIYNATNPSGRFATAGEIAELAAFMVSDMGNLIVGDTFYITGGSGIITLHN